MLTYRLYKDLKNRGITMRIKFLTIAVCSFFLSACAAGTGGDGVGGGTYSSIQPSGTQQYLDAVVGDRVYFDYDQYNVRADAVGTLENQAAWMQQFPNVTVTIEGHCDERGTREYNLALGERRANAVKDYLTLNGVDGSRIKVISYGKERPSVQGSDAGAWAENRRGVTVVN